MDPINERDQNHSAYRRLKGVIDQTYTPGHFLAIHNGLILANAPSFEELTTILNKLGENPKQVLVVQAGVDYPREAIIFAQGTGDGGLNE